MKTNKGFTLLECLVVLTIIGILSPLIGRLLISSARIMKQSQIPVAQSLIAKTVSVTSSCTQIDGSYYGRSQGSDTLLIYTNSNCSNSFGSLNRLNNPSWFNESTFTDWLVYSSSGQLKVRLVRYTRG